ncbi:MAG: hypothetical protein ACTTKL_04730 [Treponema sp.]
MFATIVRKSVIVFAIYSIAIIGIFILQFKNDSIVSDKIGALRITVLKSAKEEGGAELKNKLNAAFSGINFSAGDGNPVTAVVDGRIVQLILKSWRKTSPLSCEFSFNFDIKLTLSLSDDTNRAALAINAELPDAVSSIYVPYELASGFAVTQRTDSRIRISNKQTFWELNAAGIQNEKILLTQREKQTSYSYFDNTKTFTFAQAAREEGATEEAYAAALTRLKASVISAFANAVQDSKTPLTEQAVLSYVAAMAEKGRYKPAVDSVPPFMKRASAGTYLSIPYFGNTQKLNQLLQSELNDLEKAVEDAAENSDFSVFAHPLAADYMCLHPASKYVRQLLKNTSQEDSAAFTAQDASGIFRVFAGLHEKNPELAELLLPAAQKSAFLLENSCTLDNGVILLQSNHSFLSVLEAAALGDGLLRFGRAVSNQDYVAAGRLIITSYLNDTTELSAFGLSTLANLYPALVHSNPYYPHFQILAFEYGQAVWAWTCAEHIDYKNDGSGTITLSVKFPAQNTHYAVINGLSPFRSILIYDTAFKSDPRFESYNSSGYVYENETSSLLLKSRQRAGTEEIKLLYKETPAPKIHEIKESESHPPAPEPAPQEASENPPAENANSDEDDE